MPRIDVEKFNDRDDENVIRIKTPKPRNPHVKEPFEGGGNFAPKKHKNKKHDSYRDKRNWDQ